MLLKVLVFGTFCIACCTTTFAEFSWPGGRIPYLDDYALTANPDQAVALNNARMDLQVRTCVRFYPRRFEKDFVFFTDMGPQVECWNMFEHTKGRVEVNAGPSCLEPMRRPHRPKRVFSDCDIEYVNHLYHCPRRRRISPICPLGQNIMSIPVFTTTTTTTTSTSPTTTSATTELTTTTTSTAATTTTTTTTEATTTTMETTTTGTEAEEVDEEEAINTLELSKNEVNEEDAENKQEHHEEEESENEHENHEEEEMEDKHENHEEEETEDKMETHEEEELEDKHENLEEEVTEDKHEIHEEEREEKTKENVGTSNEIKQKDRTPNKSDNHEEDIEGEHENEKEHEAEEEESDMAHREVYPDNSEEEEHSLTTEGGDDEHEEATTANGLEYNKGGGHGDGNDGDLQEQNSSNNAEESVSENKEAEPVRYGGFVITSTAATVTEEQVITTQQPSEELEENNEGWTSGFVTLPSTLPLSTLLMMTLITTPFTTTTTIEPPTPDWVRSVEASFEGHSSSRNGNEISGNLDEIPGRSGAETSKGRERSDIAIEIIDYAGSGASAMGIGNNFISATTGAERASNNGYIENNNGGRRTVENSNRREIGTTNGVRNGILIPTSGLLGPVLISNGKTSTEDGGRMSVSQTKVTTMIEKSNYIGPCGSACSYSGDLVKLYRSHNDKTEINDHFYTTDRLEHHLMSSQGYMMQPYMGHLGQNHVDPSCSCLKPLYRLYNEFMKDHLLTSTEHEKDMAERILGYKFERVLGFCTKEPGCGAYMPLYRFYNAIAKDHLYTVDQQEMHYYRTHPEHAYGFENIECYVWQHNSSAKGCPALTFGSGLVPNSDDFARL